MARHYHADRIGPMGQADGTHRFWTAQFGSEAAVTHGPAGRDCGETGPDTALELCPCGAPFDAGQTRNVAFEVTPQQAFEIGRRGTRFRFDRSVVQAE